METSLWKKEQFEVCNEELLAYTLAKIRPFEWVRITMYVRENLFTHPPIFCWRYHDADEEVYARLKVCIEEFNGNVKWIMYKGDGSNGQSKRNYTIKPVIFCGIYTKEDLKYLIQKLGKQYNEICFKAIDDIQFLCNHIDITFGTSNLKPHLPVLPFHTK